ncbi:RNA P2-like RNA polymerase [Xanthomonas virus PB119]|nr:RNA P2-like RNA polymerase [Xanthomonas virus PB119]
MQKFTGKEYLQIDIANNFGLDKLKWSERLAWFNENAHQINQLLNQADEPALYFAGLKAWDSFLRKVPSGYMTSFDATSSGLQILACLTGDRSAAQLCNVIDFSPEAEAERRDGYTVIYEAMVENLKAIGVYAGGIERDDCKQAIMTALYGSEAMPKQVFGEGVQLRVFYQTMKQFAPGAWELNDFFRHGCWNPEAYSNDWVLPDNFHVHVKVIDTVKEVVQFHNQPYDTFYKVNQPMEEGRSIGANVTHSLDGMVVREMVRRCSFDPVQLIKVLDAISCPDSTEAGGEDTDMVIKLWNHYKKSGFLSTRILDHLNKGNIMHVDTAVIFKLIETLPDKPFEVIAVHDCFRCLPNYVNDLRQQYNQILSDIARSDLLSFILSQLLGKPTKIGKLDPDMWKDVLHAEYALS